MSVMAGNLRPWQTSSKLLPCAVALGVKGGDKYEDTRLERNILFRKWGKSNNLSEGPELLFMSGTMRGLTVDA